MAKDYSYKKSPCVICGKPRWTTKGSLPNGRCGECRTAARRAREAATEARRATPRVCAWCGGQFTGRTSSKYCSSPCREVGSRAKSRERKKFYPKTLSTSERGYGPAHQRIRRELLASFTAGTPCPFCNEPMLDGQALDLDHSDPAAKLRREPGDRLAHARCNRSTGGRQARLSGASA